MNQILRLRELRAKRWNEAKAFLDEHRGSDGFIGKENEEIYNKMEADVVKIGKEIERLERQAHIDRSVDRPEETNNTSIFNRRGYWKCNECGYSEDQLEKSNYWSYCPLCGTKTKRIIEKKILPEYYKEVIEGRKTFELRKDEDNIQPGDTVLLREWDNKYTGKEVCMEVTYVLRNVPEYGLMDGYCVFGISPK